MPRITSFKIMLEKRVHHDFSSFFLGYLLPKTKLPEKRLIFSRNSLKILYRKIYEMARIIRQE